LASTTTTGLQALINLAVSHVDERGLRFNPAKTVCISYNEHTFTSTPEWNIDGTPLEIQSHLKYLGTEIGRNSGSVHVENRISAANRAFYSLQGAGLYQHCVSPYLAAHVYSTAVRSGLMYGCHTINLSISDLTILMKAQAKYMRAVLGLRPFCHITPVLPVFGINKISATIAISLLDLLRTNLRSSSATAGFYQYLLQGDPHLHCKTLVSRALKFCSPSGIDILSYMVDDAYREKQKCYINTKDLCNNRGLIDSLCNIFNNYDNNNALLANLLLKPF
jgi:hypothetical protein